MLAGESRTPAGPKTISRSADIFKYPPNFPPVPVKPELRKMSRAAWATNCPPSVKLMGEARMISPKTPRATSDRCRNVTLLQPVAAATKLTSAGLTVSAVRSISQVPLPPDTLGTGPKRSILGVAENVRTPSFR